MKTRITMSSCTAHSNHTPAPAGACAGAFYKASDRQTMSDNVSFLSALIENTEMWRWMILNRITVRFAENELDLLKREAKKSGISVSQYVRNKVLGTFEESIFEQSIMALQQDNKDQIILLKEVIKNLRLSVNTSYAVLRATDPANADLIMKRIQERLEQ